MRYAIDLAAAIDPAKTDPNPRVGCVILENGILMAKGVHQQDGGAHAEVEAFKDLGVRKISEATLYVTMEPCSTAGRTGACTDVIIRSGMIKRVVIGDMDPNPAHRGNAVNILNRAGIRVDVGCLSRECAALNPDFYHRMQKNTS